MEIYTEKEKELLELSKPCDDFDSNLANDLINKLLLNQEYEKLINFLDLLNDFAEIPCDIVSKLINDGNKEAICAFLNENNCLYFLNDNEIKKLENYLDVKEVCIKLNENYDYYYKLLYDQGFRNWAANTFKIDDMTKHLFIKGCEKFPIVIRENNGVDVTVSYVDYNFYKLSKEEQISKEIDYLNKFKFNIKK